ncbi:tetratricopeptide repeat protein [Pararhodobacter sp. SW119]|uniref:tetratricopeptide repeat protein n=1 Tax=Pararhodobacter sp. SW119 TaxID=2780075 RepID=UPI001ADFBA08|nr:tetratricopeptide repeat protein [Pararhodobacter sp. SW119]
MILRSPALIAGLVALPLILGQCDSAAERAEAHYQSGMALVEDGDIDRALVEFRNVFNLDGQHREARAAYARLMRERGNLRDAYGHYLRLVEQYPEDLDGRLALGEMALASGDWEEAERHITQAQALAPEDSLVQAMLTTLEYREALVAEDGTRRTEAVQLAQATLGDETVSDSARIIARRVVINELLAGEDPQAAMPELEAALAEDPDNLEYQEVKLRLLIARGDVPAATEQFEEMYRRFPENEALRSGLIQWYISTENLEGAEAFLRQLAEGAETPDQAVAVVRFLRQTQGSDAAFAELDRLIAEGNHPETFRATRAVLNIEEGRVNEGVAELEALVEGGTASDRLRDIRLVLARVYQAQGNSVGARAQIETILAEDGSHVEALKMQAGWQIGADRPEEAIALLRRALDRAPRDVGALTLLAQAHERMGDRQLMGDRLALAMEASGQAPEQALRYARYLVSEERLTTARAALQESLRLNPQNADLMLVLGQVHLALQEWERAESMIAALQQLGTTEARAAANELRNRFLVAQGRTEESIAFLEGLIQSGEADVRAAALVVQGHLQAGRMAEAEEYLTARLAEDPSNPSLRFLMAGLQTAQGRLDDARATYVALIAEYPTDEAPVRALYQLDVQSGDAEAASATLQAALDRMPESVFLNWLRAGEMERAGDFEGAIAIYERLYEANRNNTLIANNLASLLSIHRDDDESLERAHAVAQRLRGLDMPAFQDTYGWIAYRRGRYAEALEHLEPAAAGLPESALVQYHLGMTYAALERPADARVALEHALELAGNSPLPQFLTARETLDSLPAEAD